MPRVESSVIREVEHDGGRRLPVRLVSGRTYVYDGVDKRLFTALLQADSIGSFFNDHIRDIFPYAELTAPPAPAR